jgi:hypothetical protein
MSTLWQRLEIRGREELELDETWLMYSSSIRCTARIAEVKFTDKRGNEDVVGHCVGGLINFRDIESEPKLEVLQTA